MKTYQSTSPKVAKVEVIGTFTVTPVAVEQSSELLDDGDGELDALKELACAADAEAELA